MASIASESIDIRPAVSVYATYRRLSYKPWYAIAEFVDNSTQSFYDHKEELLRAYGNDERPSHMQVSVSYDADENTLTVEDNAYGMEMEELTRAVVLDKPPPVRTGRCEFGMGLKTAACWFGTTWTIWTSKLGSDREYTVRVHVPDLAESLTDHVTVELNSASPEVHYTGIQIEGLYNPIRGRTVGRVKEQLGSMYREDLRSKQIEILWNGVPISFGEPNFLEEDLGNGITNVWKKDICLNVPWETEDKILRATGWVAVRTPGSQKEAGFALLRRGRVIVGGPGAGYKPPEIFGQGNTFRSQRLIGEIHMDLWPVTQAKDAFDWSGGLEDKFIEQLKQACQDYMDKAEGFRERGRPVSPPVMEVVSEPLRKVFSDKRFGNAVEHEIRFPDSPDAVELLESDRKKLQAISSGPIKYRLDVGTSIWTFRLHWQDKLSDAHWMEMEATNDNEIDVFLNAGHPFFAAYIDNRDSLELLQKFVLSLALAERMARQTATNGFVRPGDIRMLMNKVLRRAGDIEAEYGRN